MSAYQSKGVRQITRDKVCTCHTCGRDFHYLGIARHRRGHLDRGESCLITYTDGTTKGHMPCKADR